MALVLGLLGAAVWLIWRHAAQTGFDARQFLHTFQGLHWGWLCSAALATLATYADDRVDLLAIDTRVRVAHSSGSKRTAQTRLIQALAGVSPALVAVGSLDPLLPYSRAIAGWWPGARLVEVAGADHMNILGRPEVIAGIRGLAAGH